MGKCCGLGDRPCNEKGGKKMCEWRDVRSGELHECMVTEGREMVEQEKLESRRMDICTRNRLGNKVN